jgi:DNA-binding beta-propeller fold protein YncE
VSDLEAQDERLTEGGSVMVVRALLVAFFSLASGLFSPATSQTPGGLTLADEVFVGGGPGDVVVADKRGVKYVVSMLFNTGQAVTHHLAPDGTLTEVGRTVVGPEPRAIALAHNGDFAIITNSSTNQLGVFAVGDDGLLQEVNRVLSGGLNPFDVAVARQDIVTVVNRDSGQLNTFHIDRRGEVTPLDVEMTGVAPHILSVSPRGFVAVGDQTEPFVRFYEVDRRGELTQISTIRLDETPQASAWHGNRVFVVQDPPFPQEDRIRPYSVRGNGVVVQGEGTSAGVFLTDIEANEDGLFAVTVNLNDPANPTDARDEVRFYSRDGAELTLEAAVQTGGFPPSFKQIATARGRGGNTHVVTTAFQSGRLRSFLWN